MRRKITASVLFAVFAIASAVALVTYDTQEAQATRRDKVQAATTSAVSWSILEGDDFDVERITLKFASGPTTNENITITKDSGQGAAYDTVLASVDPAGKTSVVFENINGLKNGDAIVVAYTNTDGISITGVATTYLGPEHATGPIKIVLDGIEQGAPLTLGTSDIEIGAVEIKNAATDDRALVSDANTARANTNHVLSVQRIGADGTVPPTGSLNTNAPFAMLTDGTTDVTVDATTAGLDINIEGYAGAAAGSANPVDVQIGDATNAITLLTGTVKTIPVTVHDGTNQAAVGTGTTKVALAGIHDGELLASVQTSAAMATDFDGLNGLLVNAILSGYVDDDTTHTVLVDSSGHVQVDVLTLPGGLTGYAEDVAHGDGNIGIQMLARRIDTVAVSSDTDGDYSTINVDATGRLWTHDPVAEALLTTIDSDTSTINTNSGTIAGDTTSIDGKTPALGTAVMTGSVPVTIATDDTILTATNALLTTIDADTSTINTNSGTIAGDTTSIDTKTPSLGTNTMANSWPFTISTDDTMITALDTAVDSAVTALQIIDDFDESDRCKVNPIAGQAGVSANTGALDATTQRMTLATNDPAVVDLAAMEVLLTSILAVLPGASGSGYQSYIDTNFVTGDSPQTHDVNNDLGRNGDRGFIANDGPGNISVQLSESGAVSGEDAIVLENGESMSLDGWNVDQITVTWVTDSAYRIVMR